MPKKSFSPFSIKQDFFDPRAVSFLRYFGVDNSVPLTSSFVRWFKLEDSKPETGSLVLVFVDEETRNNYELSDIFVKPVLVTWIDAE